MTPMPAIQFWNSVPTVSVLSATTWSAYKDKQHHDPHASNPVLELCSQSLFFQLQPGLHTKTNNTMTPMPAIQFWNSVPTVSVLSATTWSAYKDKQHHDPHASNPVLELSSHSLCSFSYNLVCIQRQTTP